MVKNQGMGGNPMQNYWKKQKTQQLKKNKEKVVQIKKEREEKGLNQKKQQRTHIGSDEEDNYGYGHFNKQKIAEIMEEKERRRQGQYKNTADFMKEKKDKIGFTDSFKSQTDQKKNKFINVPGYDSNFISRQKANKNLKKMHQRKEEHQLKEIFSQMKKDKENNQQTKLTEEQQSLLNKHRKQTGQAPTNAQGVVLPENVKNLVNSGKTLPGNKKPWEKQPGQFKQQESNDPFYKTGQDEDYNPINDYNMNQQQLQQQQMQQQQQQQQIQKEMREQQLQKILYQQSDAKIICDLTMLGEVYGVEYDQRVLREREEQDQEKRQEAEQVQQLKLEKISAEQTQEIEEILQNQLGKQEKKKLLQKSGNQTQNNNNNNQKKAKEDSKKQLQKSIMQQLMYDTDESQEEDNEEEEEQQKEEVQENPQQVKQIEDEEVVIQEEEYEHENENERDNELSQTQLDQIKYLQQQHQQEEYQQQQQLEQEQEEYDQEQERQHFYEEQQRKLEEKQKEISNMKGPKNIMQMANIQYTKIELENKKRQAELGMNQKNHQNVIVGQSTVKKSQIDLNRNATMFLPPQLMKKRKLNDENPQVSQQSNSGQQSDYQQQLQQASVYSQQQSSYQEPSYQQQQFSVDLIQPPSSRGIGAGVPKPQFLEEEDVNLIRSQKQRQEEKKQEQNNLLNQEMFKQYLDEIKKSQQ